MEDLLVLLIHIALPRLVLSGKPEMDDWLTTLVDEYYLENEGYIVGDLIKSTFSIPLSYIDELEAIPIDREIQNILENDIFPLEILNNTTSIQNSCSNSTTIDCQMKIQLYAIQTCGDGDCLLHAISLGLWGKDDSKHYLRGLLSLTLTSTNFKKKLLPYWCEEEYYRDYSLGFQNARTLEEIQNEFEIAVNIAHQPGR